MLKVYAGLFLCSSFSLPVVLRQLWPFWRLHQSFLKTESICFTVDMTGCCVWMQRSVLVRRQKSFFFFFCRETLVERLGRAQRRREEAGRRVEAGTGSSVLSAIKADEGIWQVEEAEEMAPAQRLRLDLVKRTTQMGNGTEPTVIHRNSVRACLCVCVCVSVWN